MGRDRLAACGFALVTFGLIATAQTGDTPSQRNLRSEDLKPLAWRSIGPANMSGRVATIALAPGNPKTYFVGFATGGLWKTKNNGTTFTPVFDDKETSSIGSVAVCDAPTNWRGTRQSQSQPRGDQGLRTLGLTWRDARLAQVAAEDIDEERLELLGRFVLPAVVLGDRL